MPEPAASSTGMILFCFKLFCRCQDHRLVHSCQVLGPACGVCRCKARVLVQVYRYSNGSMKWWRRAEQNC